MLIIYISRTKSLFQKQIPKNLFYGILNEKKNHGHNMIVMP